MAKHFQFLRVPDGTLLKLAVALMRDDPEATTTFYAADDITLTLKPGQNLKKEWAKAVGPSSYLISNGSVSVPSVGFTFKFYRGQIYRHNPQYGHRWEPSEHPFIDGMEISGPSNSADRIDILATLNQFISLAPPVQLSAGGGSALDQSSAILNRVSEAVATLTEHTSERQIELDRHRLELERQLSKRVEVERRALKEEVEQEKARLLAIEEELSARASTLDDRENTHVRRELQKSMSAIAGDSLNSKLLQKSEWSFQQARIVALFFAIVLIAFAVDQSINLTSRSGTLKESVILFTEIRIVLLGLAAGALIWYALKLSSSRFRQISRWENDLNRFRLDVERASFLVEGDLEARRAGETGLPDVLLQRFSQGLFGGNSPGDSIEGDEIGSTLGHLLSRAASVKIGTDGVSVEVDKSGIKKARKDVARDTEPDE